MIIDLLDFFVFCTKQENNTRYTWSSGRSSTLDPLKVVAVRRNLIPGVGADCEMCIWYYLIMSIGTHWKGSICDKVSISDHWTSLNQDDDEIWFQKMAMVLPSTDKIHTRHQERSGSDLVMAEKLHSNGHTQIDWSSLGLNRPPSGLIIFSHPLQF